MSRHNPHPAARIARPVVYTGLAILLLTILVNLPLFDEQPDPELSAALAEIPMPRPENNAWMALWGFRAIEGVDVIEAGEALLARHDEKVSNGQTHTLTDEDFADILGQNDPGFADIDDWMSLMEPCTARAGSDCLQHYLTQLDSLDDSARLDLLIQRWHTLITMPSFVSRQMDSPEDSLPSYQLLVRVSDIALARLVRDNDPAFVSRLEQDSIFWRMVLSSNNSLVAKMVAVAMLWRDTQYLSNYLALAEQPGNLVVAERVAAPLLDNELDISEVWRYEMRLGMISVNHDSVSWQARLFMQEQATDNAAFRYGWKPLMALSRLSPSELYTYVSERIAAGEKPMACCSTAANTSLLTPAFLYNPAGKLMLTDDYDLSEINLEDYMERVFDLQGYLRLVSLQVRLLDSGTDDPAPLLANPDFANPHTGNPMQWNAVDRELFFECRGLGTYCSISL